MAKHTQIIRRPTADELFECVWLFCESGAKRVKMLSNTEAELKKSVAYKTAWIQFVAFACKAKTFRIPFFLFFFSSVFLDGLPKNFMYHL